MCGIMGYVGTRHSVPTIIEGLRRLEYREYDSAGLAVYGEDHTLAVRRARDRLRNLEETIRLVPVQGRYVIGHTRWARHGRPTENNAHPHRDCTGDIAVVHNGIVENYLELRKQLEDNGHIFRTETDTEVIAHLVEEHYDGSLEASLLAAMKKLSGVFALAALSRRDPDKIVAARSGPPVIIGLGNKENFIASDVPAILQHTREMLFLADGDLAAVTRQGVELSDFDGCPVTRPTTRRSLGSFTGRKGRVSAFHAQRDPPTAASGLPHHDRTAGA
jgi:glucosamine--fructose-6-phosphate aminotransferase (isomerizing)